MQAPALIQVRIVDEIIDETYGRLLSQAGFISAKARVWFRPRLEFANDLFAITALKGASYGPRWGFSLRFVPEIRGGRLRWHRSAKASVFDLTIDPLDTDEPAAVPSVLCALGELAALRETARRTAPEILADAERVWRRVTSLEALVAEFEHLRDRPTLRFGFYNYVQQPIAYAFTLAKLGRGLDAAAVLERSGFVEGAAGDQLSAALAQVSKIGA